MSRLRIQCLIVSNIQIIAGTLGLTDDDPRPEEIDEASTTGRSAVCVSFKHIDPLSSNIETPHQVRPKLLGVPLLRTRLGTFRPPSIDPVSPDSVELCESAGGSPLGLQPLACGAPQQLQVETPPDYVRGCAPSDIRPVCANWMRNLPARSRVDSIGGSNTRLLY